MSEKETKHGQNFQVDLSGLVKLLSQNLYSGPQVYIRELLQNGVDAITAARELNPDTPAKITILPQTGKNSPELTVTDSGIGLTTAEAQEFLATIGRSTKRDELLQEGRREFLGQFGIGMLATFMVADKITVHTRSRKADKNGQLPPAVLWIGNSDGTFTVEEIPDEQVPAEIATGGTQVHIVARIDSHDWLQRETVRSLTIEYGDLLPVDVRLEHRFQGEQMFADRPTLERLNKHQVPWRPQYDSAAERENSLSNYCQETFGFRPPEIIDLQLDLLGIDGVAFVIPQRVPPNSSKHRVYLKQMLLSDRSDKILPEWAFFVRAAINVEALSPTASREDLRDTHELMVAREQLGKQLKEWLINLLTDPDLEDVKMLFLSAHGLALRAAAAQDTELLELITNTLPFETTAGRITLQAAREKNPENELVFAPSVEDFRRIESVARAANITVVNAGYAYDNQIIDRLQASLKWKTREISPQDITSALSPISSDRETATEQGLAAAREFFEETDCDVLLRTFEPADVPAMLLFDPEAEYHAQTASAHEEDPDMWNGMLQSLLETGSFRARTIILNDACPVVRNLLENHHDETVFNAGLSALFVSASAMSGTGLASGDTAILSDALDVLLKRALQNNSDETGA
ncbi:MAG: HSP90 family protein [Microbacteriaceae bacterium]|nr:HSP90 family protein [Microbacteriaceae bacterium]